MKNLMFKKQLGLLLTTVCIVLSCGCPPPPPPATEYKYTELLPDGWQESFAVGINNKEEVVGHGKDSNGIIKAFLYSNGEFTELLPDGWTSAYGRGINNNGTIVGYSGVSKGFIYSKGEFTELLPEGLTYADPLSINDNEKVVGVGPTSEWVYKVFIYSNGKYAKLLPYGWTSVYGGDINNNGTVVGYGPHANEWEDKVFICRNYIYKQLSPPLGYDNISMVDINDNGELLVVMVLNGGKGPYKSFIYRNGKYNELLPPGFEDFHGYAINNKGEVIGTTFNGKAFIYTYGKFIELTLGSWYLEPRGINDYGVITGYLWDRMYLWLPYGVRKGFVAYPVFPN